MVKPNATPETRSVRLLKVGEQVRHILSEILQRGDVHDEVLAKHLVSVTEVRMSPDLKHATCFVEPLGAGVDAAPTDSLPIRAGAKPSGDVPSTEQKRSHSSSRGAPGASG